MSSKIKLLNIFLFIFVFLFSITNTTFALSYKEPKMDIQLYENSDTVIIGRFQFVKFEKEEKSATIQVLRTFKGNKQKGDEFKVYLSGWYSFDMNLLPKSASDYIIFLSDDQQNTISQVAGNIWEYPGEEFIINYIDLFLNEPEGRVDNSSEGKIHEILKSSAALAIALLIGIVFGLSGSHFYSIYQRKMNNK